MNSLFLCLLEVTKVLTKIGKFSGCETINGWIKACTNHLYWCATTTPDGNGEVIYAKFQSFFSHIINKHSNLENQVFNKCAHGDAIEPRKWLDQGENQ
jgi:hypothetical protein